MARCLTPRGSQRPGQTSRATRPPTRRRWRWSLRVPACGTVSRQGRLHRHIEVAKLGTRRRSERQQRSQRESGADRAPPASVTAAKRQIKRLRRYGTADRAVAAAARRTSIGCRGLGPGFPEAVNGDLRTGILTGGSVPILHCVRITARSPGGSGTVRAVRPARRSPHPECCRGWRHGRRARAGDGAACAAGAEEPPRLLIVDTSNSAGVMYFPRARLRGAPMRSNGATPVIHRWERRSRPRRHLGVAISAPAVAPGSTVQSCTDAGRT